MRVVPEGLAMPESLGRFLTTDQICDLLGVKRWTLWYWGNQGKGPPRMRATDHGPWLYPERPFEDWARSRLSHQPTQ
jgi:predicted DNA-binding transcriptional regulator AlpA